MEVKQRLNVILLNLASNASQGAAYEQWSDEFARKEVREIWSNSGGTFNPKRDPFTLDELRTIPREELYELGFGNWDHEMLLFPLWVVNFIKDGEKVVDINGKESILDSETRKDNDVRYGCVAYGFRHAD